MIGRRVYPEADGNLPETFQPGDYGKDLTGRWFALPPEVSGAGGRGVWLNKPDYSWQIQEHEDGTITVAPSIHCLNEWHGFLERGIWRKC